MCVSQSACRLSWQDERTGMTGPCPLLLRAMMNPTPLLTVRLEEG